MDFRRLININSMLLIIIMAVIVAMLSNALETGVFHVKAIIVAKVSEPFIFWLIALLGVFSVCFLFFLIFFADRDDLKKEVSDKDTDV